jgi:hypothetical protein
MIKPQDTRHATETKIRRFRVRVRVRVRLEYKDLPCASSVAVLRNTARVSTIVTKTRQTDNTHEETKTSQSEHERQRQRHRTQIYADRPFAKAIAKQDTSKTSKTQASKQAPRHKQARHKQDTSKTQASTRARHILSKTKLVYNLIGLQNKYKPNISQKVFRFSQKVFCSG